MRRLAESHISTLVVLHNRRDFAIGPPPQFLSTPAHKMAKLHDELRKSTARCDDLQRQLDSSKCVNADTRAMANEQARIARASAMSERSAKDEADILGVSVLRLEGELYTTRRLASDMVVESSTQARSVADSEAAAAHLL